MRIIFSFSLFSKSVVLFINTYLKSVNEMKQQLQPVFGPKAKDRMNSGNKLMTIERR
jgi:hypothetical protein